MTNDADLLRRYAEHQDQTAFNDLVRSRLGFVYNCALRVAGGNAALAQDATQMVFSDLARRAKKLQRHPALIAWLHKATRFAVLGLQRSEARRRSREDQAIERFDQTAATESVEWSRLQPVLDTVIAELKERDRVAILLRFFENRSLREIAGVLNLTETAARSCVDRALDRMRAHLGKRGIISTATGIAVALEAQSAVAAPAAWVSTLSTASLANAAAAATAQIILMKKVIVCAAAVIVASECATAVVQLQHHHTLQQRESDSSRDASVESAEMKPEKTVSSDISVPSAVSSHPAEDQRALEVLRARLARLKARPATVTDATMQSARNVGQKNATAAAQTLFSLLQSHDLPGLAKYVVFSDDTPENRRAFMNEFSTAIQARYPTPELVIAAVSFNQHLQDTPTAIQILDTTSEASGAEVVKTWVQYASGQEESSELPFQPSASGWTLTSTVLMGQASPVSWLNTRLDPTTGDVRPQKSP